MLPPAAITLTADSCDAPVKVSSERAHAWATDAPAATAPTPKEMPNTPIARPRVTLARMTGASAGSERSKRDALPAGALTGRAAGR